MTFGYTDYTTTPCPTGFQASIGATYVGNPGNPASFNWPHLNVVNSGYGGSITFAYTQNPAAGTLDIWTREVVNTKIENPGAGPTQTTTYSYTGNPQYMQGTFRGFSQVRETDANSNYIVHYFNTIDPNDGAAEKLTGLETQTQWYSSDGTLLKTVQNQWGFDYTVPVYDSLREWGDNAPTGMFAYPRGVATSNDGFVYVADASNFRIQKFTGSGNFVVMWGSRGSADGQFNCPNQVAVDNSGYVYVLDSQFVKKFTRNGNFVSKWALPPNGSYSYGITIANDGSIYLTDINNQNVQKFTNSGTLITSWGSYGTGNGQFNYPWGITTDNNGYVYVSDMFNNRVQKFTSTGTFVTAWGSFGNGNGQFNWPAGISIGNEGNVYVEDRGNYRVQSFTSTGSFVTTWGSYGSGNGQFYDIYGIAGSTDGYIYLPDMMHNRIEKFSNAGNYITQWGSTAINANGQFNGPWAVATDNNGYIYVADSFNQRIQKFTGTGTFVTTWGSAGSGISQFNFPCGISVGNIVNGGYIYVLDANNNRVQIFNNGGGYINYFGSQGSGNGQFNSPQGITVGSDGYIYVVDTGNNRIEKFDYSGNFITTWGSNGAGNGQFNNPIGIAMGSDGFIYVTDYLNNRVQKFTNSGTFVAIWGSAGSGDGQYSWPTTIGASSDGYLYVGDNNNGGRIQKFTNSSSYITKVCSYQTGIVIGGDGYVYTINCPSNRLQKFQQDYSIKLTEVDTTMGGKVTRTRYSYDSYGNIITEFDDGDTSTSADDSTIWRVFNANTTTAYIVDKPARERTYATAQITDDGGVNLKKETDYYYDGSYDPVTGFAGNDTQTPTKGNLTRITQMTGTTPPSITSNIGFDSYGNKIAEKDANNNLTKWTYDSAYHTYPATKIDAITSLTESYTYDPGTNNLLTMTDVRNQTTTYQYDPFKRLTKIFKPGDDIPTNRPYTITTIGGPGLVIRPIAIRSKELKRGKRSPIMSIPRVTLGNINSSMDSGG